MRIKAMFITVCALSILCCVVQAQETEISRRDVPAAVLATFGKDYPDAKVLEWEKEIHNGKVYYEAETVDGKIARNVMYSTDGATAQIEEKVTPKDLPLAIADSLKQLFPGASVRSAYKVIHLDITEYALSMSGTSPAKLVLSGDGTVVSKEGKKAIDRIP